MKQLTCKCGLLILIDDSGLKVSHELPECPWFLEQIAKTKA
jgi:hypothetical protein